MAVGLYLTPHTLNLNKKFLICAFHTCLGRFVVDLPDPGARRKCAHISFFLCPIFWRCGPKSSRQNEYYQARTTRSAPRSHVHSMCQSLFRFDLNNYFKFVNITVHLFINISKYLHVKHFDVAVVRGGAKHLWIGRECQRSNWHGMSFKWVQQLARLQVKYIYKTVDGTACQIFAVWTLNFKV